MTTPMLYIFSGLPASGKSTLAQSLANRVGAAYLRVDTLEQAFVEFYGVEIYAEGYQLCYRLAEENLLLGVPVIADSCNPVRMSRDEWEQVATRSGAIFTNIEIHCSDSNEHRKRVEQRIEAANEPTGHLPTWDQVQKRHYEPWHKEVITIDTAAISVKTAFAQLCRELNID